MVTNTRKTINTPRRWRKKRAKTRASVHFLKNFPMMTCEGVDELGIGLGLFDVQVNLRSTGDETRWFFGQEKLEIKIHKLNVGTIGTSETVSKENDFSWKDPSACVSVRQFLCTSFRAPVSVRQFPCASIRAPVSVHQFLCTSFCAPVSVHQFLCTSFCAPVSVHQFLCTSFCASVSVHHSAHPFLCTSLSAPM